MRLFVLAALLCLVLPAAASASLVQRVPPPHAAHKSPRIVNGTPAAPGEYPAQGFLQVQLGPTTFASCGGTLIGTRQFLTAAHCATEGPTPLDPAAFTILLGDNDLAEPNTDLYGVVTNDVNLGWDPSTNDNDTALLTLDRPASAYEPMRVADPRESSIWDPGRIMRIIGWGRTSSGGTSSQVLRKADVPITTDAFCGSAYANFDPVLMICAADPVGTPSGETHDTCQGDSGGPLLATDDDGFFADVGVVSFGNGCADPDFPGVYARIGEGPLNTWVNDRIPHASFNINHAAVAGQPVTLFSTSTHPEGDGYFTSFKWDFNADGRFDDGIEGKSIDVTFPSPGRQVIGLEAAKPGGDVAVFYGAFNVASPPPPPAPPASGGTPPPPAVSGPVARFIGPKRLRAKHGRFKYKVAFSPAAPTGRATLKVLFKGKVIGSARVTIKPSTTVRGKFRLTKPGLKRLRTKGKLKVSLRLRLSGKTYRKTVTLKK